jgi:hypothetical protein
MTLIGTLGLLTEDHEDASITNVGAQLSAAA